MSLFDSRSGVTLRQPKTVEPDTDRGAGSTLRPTRLTPLHREISMRSPLHLLRAVPAAVLVLAAAQAGAQSYTFIDLGVLADRKSVV